MAACQLSIPLTAFIFFVAPYNGEFQVQSFFAALKALSRKEVNYGAYATTEQVF